MGIRMYSWLVDCSRGVPTAASEVDALLPEDVSRFVRRAPEGEVLRLDKLYPLVRFIVSGVEDDESADGAALFFNGGTLGDEDLGMGPIRFIPPAALADVSSRLDALTVSDIERRLDLIERSGLRHSPGASGGSWRDDLLECVAETAALLRRGAVEQKGAFVWLA